MTPPPHPHRRGIRDLTSAVDRSSAPGSQQNVFWKLFKMETKRLMAEREEAAARQRAEIAARRRDAATAKMRELLDDARVSAITSESAAAPAAPVFTHRYGRRR
jgi:hypothetical protein